MKKDNYNIFNDKEYLKLNYTDEEDFYRKRDLVRVLKEINQLEMPILTLISQIFTIIVFVFTLIILYKVW